MHLIAFSLEGYRRFAAKTSVKLHGDLIAFVGPNEAGKSSLLRALAHLHRDGPFEPTERPRRSNLQPTLTWHFQLDADDKACLDPLPDTGGIERVRVVKKSDGSKRWSFDPRSPTRDRTGRLDTLKLLDAHRDNEPLRLADVNETLEFTLDDYDRVRETLGADVENYASDHLEGMRDLARRLRLVEFPALAADEEDDAQEVNPEDEEVRTVFLADRDAMATSIEQVAAAEGAPSPFRQAVQALEPRLPAIVMFEEPDRDLASEYDLAEVAADPPLALDHLAGLAGLDLVALRDEAAGGQVADVATRRLAANAALIEAFEQSWNQQGIAIQIDVQGVILHIQATTPEDKGLSGIAERSDGMRWFAALLAFSHGWTEAPILLVDEIEQHLHYDAQADLVAVLSQQRFTSKVIYTTHSFGCLPYDLGTGVRVVLPIDAATSRLENGFWKQGSGFSPLLASMGAAAMSFTPTRHAIISEGAADAILLPTLLRHAAGEERLDFQVAPGLSSVAASSVPDLEAEAGRVGFLVDGDGGGRAIFATLVRAGISADRIIILENTDTGTAHEVEDLIDPDTYVRAVNDELRCWNHLAEEVVASDVGDSLRTKALKQWCEQHGMTPPDKVAVAQRVVDMASDRPVHATRHADRLRELLKQVRTILQLG